MTANNPSHQTEHDGHDTGFIAGVGLAMIAAAALTVGYTTGGLTWSETLGAALVVGIPISLITGRWFA